MSDETDLLKGVYNRFNARDMETVLAAMHEDVIWANGMEGGHVHRREEVRKYWTRQWPMIDPHVEPVEFAKGPGGQVVVPSGGGGPQREPSRGQDGRSRVSN
jgi:hypothetical protein